MIELFNLIQEVEKYGIEVFVSYSPHVNLLNVTIFDINFEEYTKMITVLTDYSANI